MTLLSAVVHSGERNGDSAILNVAIGNKLIQKLEVGIREEHHRLEKDEDGVVIAQLPVLIGVVIENAAARKVRAHIPNLGNNSALDLHYRATLGESELTGEIDFDTRSLMRLDE